MQAASCWTVKPVVTSNAEGATGSFDVRTFTLNVLPWIEIPAVGLASIEARQKSFGAVAPPLSVTLCACHALGF